MYRMNELSAYCVICKCLHKNRCLKSSLVNEPCIEHIQDILSCAKHRVELGEVGLQPLVEFLSDLSTNELAHIRYHSICRKSIVHKAAVDRGKKRKLSLTDDDALPQPKRGRPRTKSATCSARPKRCKGEIDIYVISIIILLYMLII